MKPTLFCLFLLILLTGCMSTGGGSTWTLWNPTTWGAGRDARKVERRKIEIQDTRSKALLEAQALVHEANELLKQAPASRPVELALETNSLAAEVIDRTVGPLPISEVEHLRKQVQDLLSNDVKLREAAERERVERRADAVKVTTTLTRLTAELETAQTNAATEALENLKVSNQYRNLKFGIFLFIGAWVFITIILPLIGRAFPAVGAVANGMQAVVAPFAVAAGNRAKQVLTDVVTGVHYIRKELKEQGTVDKERADSILGEYVTQEDGTATYVDEIRRKEKLIRDKPVTLGRSDGPLIREE